MSMIKRTVFHDLHVSSGAKMVDFGGWHMPLMYPAGIIDEHLSTRKRAGLFDVSHMGRFVIRGKGALDFLQYVLTNNALALDTKGVGAQYTIIPTKTGGALDDAYLYSFSKGEYLLVVNAVNRDNDWEHLKKYKKNFSGVELIDRTEEIAMLALQGPMSRNILETISGVHQMPEPFRNAVGILKISGREVMVSRTGYTGEPLCFELFVKREEGPDLWKLLTYEGAIPIGLGARDTLRLEAGLPLHGHELGTDFEGREIPVIACPAAKPAVSFSAIKGDYIGREELMNQFEAFARIMSRDYSMIESLPRMIRPLALLGRGVARQGAVVSIGGESVGRVTSGTMVPMWSFQGEGITAVQTDQHSLRSICLSYINSDIPEGSEIVVDIRGKDVQAVVVPYHMKADAPPYARPIVAGGEPENVEARGQAIPESVQNLISKTLENTRWRATECINLIPSEMTTSPMVRLLSVMDPAFRYGEHRKIKAFYDNEIFYYQGTEFIREVERKVEAEFKKYLGCREVETRLISGQMANMAVFSALVEYINRMNPRGERRRIRQVMNNHIGKGGHLSAQSMGALKDYVAQDPLSERPAVVNFPVLAANPFKVDLAATLRLIEEYRPELIIFGKSMCLHREPVAEIRSFLDSSQMDAIIMYDMAHVLGLVGQYFQQPFEEGADLVTGSTHKTYFGPQRGVVGCGYQRNEERFELWEAVERRTFPGSVSNHHLGTLLGLLMAAYEMNYFKEAYQPQVLSNAKAFARNLKDTGLDVAGDPSIDFTETHQVVLKVGYGRGPEMAQRLEANNIICNYQACPNEEGFTASGALRLGVSEMTRYGMGAEDFGILAEIIHDILLKNTDATDQVKLLRSNFTKLKFCFSIKKYEDLIGKLHELI